MNLNLNIRKQWLDPRKVAQTFYMLCRKACKVLKGRTFAPLYLNQHSFIVCDKISHIQCIWDGGHFQRQMIVNIDLAPAFRFDDNVIIAKASRHHFANRSIEEANCDKWMMPRSPPFWHVSDTENQCKDIQNMPLKFKHALIIAKALRLAIICGTGLLKMHLGQDVDIQKMIRTYSLKQLLAMLQEMNKNGTGDRFKNDNAYNIARKIYMLAFTKHNLDRSFASNFDPDCHATDVDIATALYYKIIEYLTKHQAEFDELAKHL